MHKALVISGVPQMVEGQCCCRWFFFRVTGVRDEQLHLNIVNAGEGSFPTVPPHHLPIVSPDMGLYSLDIASMDAMNELLSLAQSAYKDSIAVEPSRDLDCRT